MTFIGNRRLRAGLIGAVALAVVAAVGVGAANASSTTSSRWVTATATSGDVAQVYTTSGSISRKNTVAATFTADGTVRTVKVAVGDQVSAGQVLAKLDTRALTLAVLEAETSLAQAKLSLYNAQNPSSSSSGNGPSAASGSSGASVDLATLNKVAGALSTAVKAESTACDPILTWINDDVQTSTDDTGATPSASPSPTASATASTEPTLADLAACGKARAGVTAADQRLQAFLKHPTSTSSAAKSTTTTSVSASQVAQAKAAVLSAQQKLNSATDDVDAAELLAPISGTVGAVTLSKGDSASAGSITIVGSGNAQVSFEVPLATRSTLRVGGSATVTAAGSSSSLTGTITNINVLETSGTSGSPTFTTTVTVRDPGKLLADGAKASVAIPVTSVTGVVTVPASALTPTGTGTGTVLVLNTGSDTPTSTTVSTGAVGGGLVEITEGLTAGAVVVLADRTAEIPSNSTTRNRSRSSSSSSSSSSASKSGNSSTGSQPSSQPSK